MAASQDIGGARVAQHLFVLDESVFAAIGRDEACDTVQGLISLGLYALPVSPCDVRVTPRVFITLGYTRFADRKAEVYWADKLTRDIVFRGVRQHEAPQMPSGLGLSCEGISTVNLDGTFSHAFSIGPYDEGEQTWLQATCMHLICALAARNVDKKVREHKLSRLGIGKPKQYTHVTTIRVPQTQYLPDDEDHPPTGRSVRAHFRRGFVRAQHYGERNALTKQVWIAPVFVNADADWVGEQKTYRLVA